MVAPTPGSERSARTTSAVPIRERFIQIEECRLSATRQKRNLGPCLEADVAGGRPNFRTRPIADVAVRFDNLPCCIPFSGAARHRDSKTAKAYWVAAYRSVSDPEALAAHAKLSGPAILAAGGRILARGMPSHCYEEGLQQRTVVIEFDSVEQAKAAHDSAAYQEALKLLEASAERDIRIIEGV